jgi:hypothetical protein
MIVTFETLSGSTYEVDEDAKQIRRLTGTRPAQPRQGRDGEWRAFEGISPIEIGRSVIIAWPRATTPLLAGSPDGATPATVTSLVKRVAVRDQRCSA